MIIELDQHLIVSVKSDFMSKCIMVTQEWVHFLLGCVKRACWNTLRYTHCCFSELTPVHSLCCAHGRSETCSVLSLNPASYLCTHTLTHTQETNQQPAVWWSNLNQWIFLSHFNPPMSVHVCACGHRGIIKEVPFMWGMDSFPILLLRCILNI